jgi:hypothetical protein
MGQDPKNFFQTTVYFEGKNEKVGVNKFCMESSSVVIMQLQILKLENYDLKCFYLE